MMNYTNAEMVIYCLIEVSIYYERYPNRALPNNQFFSNIHRRPSETISCHKGASGGRPRNV